MKDNNKASNLNAPQSSLGTSSASPTEPSTPIESGQELNPAQRGYIEKNRSMKRLANIGSVAIILLIPIILYFLASVAAPIASLQTSIFDLKQTVNKNSVDIDDLKKLLYSNNVKQSITPIK